MKALISPLEPRETGYRVAWTNSVEIEHAPPYFWVSCANDVIQDEFWYDPSDQTIKAFPIVVNTAEQNKKIAQELLSDTDWVNQPDVINVDVTPHLLNQPEFISYRIQIRSIALNPTEGNLDWPIKPEEQWSNT